jgi:hypothetical protein
MSAAAIEGSSTRSVRVIATTACSTPSTRQVATCSRHPALVGGDDEHDDLNSEGARRHGAGELGVAGHVDHGDAASVGERPWGKAELDRHAARPLLLEPIAVHAGQGLDQRGLAVVHVAGGADDHG